MYNYKYDPNKFCNTPNLSDDLSDFYTQLKIYRENKNDSNWFTFRQKWENLFFTIKHREVEGFLNPTMAQEMRNYLEVLAND